MNVPQVRLLSMLNATKADGPRSAKSGHVAFAPNLAIHLDRAVSLKRT
jgi:hypothetical protein